MSVGMKGVAPAVVLAAGALISYVALFMTVSVLAIFLSECALVPSQIGIVIGTIGLLASVLGFWGGRLSGVITERYAVAAGSVLAGVAYLGLSQSRSYAAFLALAAAAGVARSVSEPAMKSLMAQNPIAGKPDLVFRFRYIAICAGAVLGPVIALAFPSKQAAIAATGAILVVYGVVFAAVWGALSPRPVGGEHRPATADRNREAFGSALADRRLLGLVATGLVVFLVFSMFESMVPLALGTSFRDASSRFSAMLIANAALGILLQFPATLVNAKVSTRALAIVGCGCFAVAYLLFARAGASFPLWIVGVVAFTVGEALTIPAGEILIDRIAPEEHKASYFGLAELRQLGFFAGPAVGGIVLESRGHPTLFVGGAGLMIMAGLGYLASADRRAVVTVGRGLARSE